MIKTITIIILSVTFWCLFYFGEEHLKGLDILVEGEKRKSDNLD